MKSEERPLILRMLTDKDKMGWLPLPSGLLGIANTRVGAAMVRVMVHKFGPGGIEGGLYDQPLQIEDPGCVVVVRSGDSVAMVRNFRMTGERPLDLDGKGYVARLLENEDRLSELLASMGEWKWELPRGYPPLDRFEPDGPSGDGMSPEKLLRMILGIAKAEAQEEAGLELSNPRVVCRINPNSTFYSHAQYVVEAELGKVGQASPEPTERIGRMKFMSPSDIREMVDGGQLTCGWSLAALSAVGFHF